MSKNGTILEDLKAIGLNTLGSRLYLALLQRGTPATGYELAKDLGVARANVYDALRGMVQAGFTLSFTTADGGTRYQPVPFVEVGERHIHEIVARVERLQTMLPALGQQPSTFRGVGWPQFRQQVERVMQSAQQSIIVGTSVRPAQDLKSILETPRSVAIRFGCWDGCPESGCGVCRPPVQHLHRWTHEPACLVVVDDRIGVGSWGNPEEPAVMATDLPVVVAGWRALVGT